MDNQIKATIIADSINANNNRLTSFELEYHRYIHSEVMTHRVFSRNAASSRAIPVSATISQVWDNPATPTHWGRNQPGMQAKKELYGLRRWTAIKLWKTAAKITASIAYLMTKAGMHKQVTNRILEPFVLIKVVLSATEFDNFFELRDHHDAQPEIQELARKMKAALALSTPNRLQYDEWHTPYADPSLSIEDRLKVSASCCAQVSYRKLDESLDKAIMVYDRLVRSKPLHASPFEHQATPSTLKDSEANFKGWMQYRKDIEQSYHVAGS
jgi:hypothetical protein